MVPFSRETGGSYECRENTRGSMACLEVSASEKYHLFYVSLPQVEAVHLQKYSIESVVFRWRIVSIRILRKPALDCVASLISRAK